MSDPINSPLARTTRGAAASIDQRLLISKKDYGPAMHQLLEIVKRDRAFRKDGARIKMLAVFEMAAADPELVTEYRSRLASLLF